MIKVMCLYVNCVWQEPSLKIVNTNQSTDNRQLHSPDKSEQRQGSNRFETTSNMYSYLK